MSSFIVENFDIRELSDEDLVAKLAECGFAAGPIVESTRLVYQRKLAKLLSIENSDFNDDFVEEPDVLEEEPILPFTPKCIPYVPSINMTYSPSSPDRFNFNDLRRRPLPRARNDFESSATVSSPYQSSKLLTQPQHEFQPAKPSLLSFKAKLIITAVVLGFLFVVYQNMEASPANPVPKT